MRRGVTLVEILVVIAILSILAGGVFYAYREISQKGVSQALVAKQEQDVQFVVSTLVQELSSVGFGVDKDRLKVLNNGTNLADVGNSLIAISGGEIRFISLAVRQGTNIGCWGVTDNNGNLTTQARDFLFRPCNFSISGSDVVCLSLPDRTDVTSGGCRDAIVFYKGSNNYPTDFVARYYLYNSGTASKLCAPDTQTLGKQVGSDSVQPLVDCVGAFRVRYVVSSGGGITYSDSVSDINDLLGVRLCLMLQVGGRQSTALDPTNFSDNCGGPISIPNDWRYYRWATVEVDIPLRNIR